MPLYIATGSDGALWFTESNTNPAQIGRITTSGVITEYKLPAGYNTPSGITLGPDGAIWFAVSGGSKIGRITTAGAVTGFPLPVSTEAYGITAGPDGALWFTGNGFIGRMTTTGVLTQYPMLVKDFSTIGGDIKVGPDGALWFSAGQLGRVTTAGVVTDYQTPPPNYPPQDMTAGPDGAMWFSLGGAIARIDTAGNITQYSVPNLLGQGSFGITTGPDGAIWYTISTPSSSFIGRVTTAGVSTQYKTPTITSDPFGITAGPDGALWFVERTANKIGRIQVSQSGSGFVCTNTTAPAITSVDSASAYGGYPYFASGSWLEIKGTNLADPADPRLTAATNPGQWVSGDFTGSNAPTALDGVSVSINGKPAYVWYLSTGQLNVQAPEDSATGNVAITVTNCKATSSLTMFARRALAPGFLAPANYTANGTQYMVATFASDGAYVLNTSTGTAFGLNSRPAKPGDLIVAYGIGFGDVTPSILPGVIAGASNALVDPITVSFGSTPATLAYSGLAGNFVGLYEFYITVPSTLANGDYQINVTQSGTPVPQTMYLTIHN
jgi:virginiamycin B lyase